jgi:acyl-CoA synthetase (AMP-forming)/AMP-acid ligase II
MTEPTATDLEENATVTDTLLERIAAHARTGPSRNAVTFVQGRANDRTERRLTYGELNRTARRIGRWLAERCAPGDRILLLLPSGLDFVTALFGCHYAGLIAVPAPPPGMGDRKGGRSVAISEDAGARLVFTDSAHLDDVRGLMAEAGLDALPCYAVDTIEPGADEPAGEVPELSGDTIAVLQYTSGSTSEPKGVMVTHGALTHNLRSIQGWLGVDETTRVCSWLPLYHDMGLIGMLLTVLYVGGEVVLFAPTDFIRRPHTWFDLVQSHRCTLITAPNFAYDLMVRQLSDEQVAALDLSSVRWALNGAEPLDAATLTRFGKRFASAGFPAGALIPCYGLAEATLFVAGTPAGRGPLIKEVDTAALEGHVLQAPSGDAQTTQPLVSSGRVLDLDVRIIDPDTLAERPAGHIGEIWVRGGSVTPGYWNRPEENARTFGQALADGTEGFLRTGDLGVLHEGELYVTGRSKDVMVVRGRNLYAHDLERHVSGLHEGFTGLRASACALPYDEEQLVVMQEFRATGGPTDLTDLARRVRGELSEQFGVRVPNVVFLRPGQVRRTTSGKVRRSMMRDLFMAGELKTVHEDLAPEVTRRHRAGAVQEAVGGAAV